MSNHRALISVSLVAIAVVLMPLTLVWFFMWMLGYMSGYVPMLSLFGIVGFGIAGLYIASTR